MTLPDSESESDRVSQSSLGSRGAACRPRPIHGSDASSTRVAKKEPSRFPTHTPVLSDQGLEHQVLFQEDLLRCTLIVGGAGVAAAAEADAGGVKFAAISLR